MPARMAPRLPRLGPRSADYTTGSAPHFTDPSTNRQAVGKTGREILQNPFFELSVSQTTRTAAHGILQMPGRIVFCLARGRIRVRQFKIFGGEWCSILVKQLARSFCSCGRSSANRQRLSAALVAALQLTKSFRAALRAPCTQTLPASQ